MQVLELCIWGNLFDGRYQLLEEDFPERVGWKNDLHGNMIDRDLHDGNER